MLNIRDINTNTKKLFTATRHDNNKVVNICSLCNTAIAGTVSHFKDHLLSVHKEKAAEIGISSRKRSSKRSNNESESADGSEVEAILPITKKQVRFTVDINVTIRNCLKHILKRNVSMSGADDLGQKELLGLMFKPFGITLNRKKLKEYISIASRQVYSLIQSELRNSYPSVMYDSSSRHGKNIFTVSSRFVNDYGSHQERTLGMLRQSGPQYGNILKDQIKELLYKVGVQINQIYVACSDGGSNMIRAANLLVEAQNEYNIFMQLGAETDDDIVYQNLELGDLMEDEIDEDEIEMIDSESLETQQDETIENNLVESPTILDFDSPLCSKMSCTAHLCQNAVHDTIKNFKSEILAIRKYVKELRKPKYADLFQNTKKVRNDNDTRWNSTFHMISDLFDSKNELRKLRSVTMRGDLWLFVDEYRTTFEHVNEGMLHFQRNDISISDCYIFWAKMLLKLKKVKDGKYLLSSSMSINLEVRGKKFFDCEAFVASLVLDPRFNWSLDHSVFNLRLRDRGIAHLLKIHDRLKTAEQSSQSTLSQENILELSCPLPTSSNDDDDSLISFLGGGARVNQTNLNVEDMRYKILNFATIEPRAKVTEDFKILDYWNSKKNDINYADLYPIAKIVYGAAFSQVKCERDFSALLLVYNHLRTKMSSETLNNILILKCNIDLLEKVKFI